MEKSILFRKDTVLTGKICLPHTITSQQKTTPYTNVYREKITIKNCVLPDTTAKRLHPFQHSRTVYLPVTDAAYRHHTGQTACASVHFLSGYSLVLL